MTTTSSESSDRPLHRQNAIDLVGQLLTVLRQHGDRATADPLTELAEHLDRAVRSFHMEAIRFRMFSFDRGAQAAAGLPPTVRELFDRIRLELEAAGFATRSVAN